MLERLHVAAIETDSSAELAATRPACVAVRRLTLTDFRCYGQLRLETDSRPVVLTGANGAGKTNILEAISYLVPGRGLRRAKLSEVARSDARENILGHDGAIAWAVSATSDVAGREIEIGTGYQPDPNARTNSREKRVVKIDGDIVKNQIALGQCMSAQWLTPQMDRLFLEGASGRRRFLDRLILGFDPDHASPVAAYEHSLRSRAKLLRDGVKDAAWLASIEESMAAHGVAMAVRRKDAVERLLPFCGSAYGPFPGAEITLSGELETWLAEGPALAAEERMKARLAVTRDLDAEHGSASIGPHRSDFAVRHMGNGSEAARCSTGEQKALLIGLVL
ncbi:MAG: replication/repair protein RecF, partial [Rhodospirillales bacterium]|nr:replication/repair protein RecF [Rhodospirillales bacterium]